MALNSLNDRLAGRYRIYYVNLLIRSREERLARLIDNYLEPFRSDSEAEPDLIFDLELGPHPYPIPTHADRFLRFWELRGYSHHGIYYFTDYFSQFIIDRRGREVKGLISEETFQENGERFFTHTLFSLSLYEALRHHGLYHLHAAALQDQNGEGYIFAANGYSGKSTITISLVHRGFSYLTDDTVFLRLDDQGVEILPFIREFHVPNSLVDKFDELKFLGQQDDFFPHHPKKALDPRTVYAGRHVSSMTSPKWLFFPELVDMPESSLQPLTSAKAMTILLPQSLFVMFNPEIAAGHLKALSTLIAGAKAFRLLCGQDLRENPELIAEVIAAARKKC